MNNKVLAILRGGWVLLRFIAVIFSSVATIISSLLPLFLFTSIPTGQLFWLFIFLAISAFAIHGVLTHAFNDYTDYRSGTDNYSPGILSGGSRVIQKGMFSLQTIRLLGIWFSVVLIILAILLLFFAQYKLTILLLIGIWGAASYSLPPFRFSYRPFLGEWFSLFPAILSLGIAGPWIILGTIPLWAYQNAVINALFCLAWVMVHHIPDLEADKRAIPKKRTTVVWFVDMFGLNYARFPALFYLLAVGLCTFWLGLERIWAAGVLFTITIFALVLVMKINVEDHQQVTIYEKALLFLAMITAICLGVFI
ncbi:prenyltransferase [Oceanobacillus chungangensis]|uniref:Prenyltransferase n=1 Tax=Oceanobacillus chungangensis TaxID=1229152 RepID=A0A3D8PJN5_9BACI|nr:prenyltransferase [Oceanobacillus chungangensis]RDW15441.1 prenyltransferase [Oceanobacillus chungangensis]